MMAWETGQSLMLCTEEEWVMAREREELRLPLGYCPTLRLVSQE